MFFLKKFRRQMVLIMMRKSLRRRMKRRKASVFSVLITRFDCVFPSVSVSLLNICFGLRRGRGGWGWGGRTRGRSRRTSCKAPSWRGGGWNQIPVFLLSFTSKCGNAGWRHYKALQEFCYWLMCFFSSIQEKVETKKQKTENGSSTEAEVKA